VKRMANALRALGGLFFDDGRLALAIVVLLGFTGIAAKHASPWASMALLVGGTLALLLESVIRAAAAR